LSRIPLICVPKLRCHIVQLARKATKRNVGESWSSYRKKQFSNLAALNWLMLKSAQALLPRIKKACTIHAPEEIRLIAASWLSDKYEKHSRLPHPSSALSKSSQPSNVPFPSINSPIVERARFYPTRATRYVLPHKIEYTENGEVHRAGL
jgi:hypothetical protein